MPRKQKPREFAIELNGNLTRYPLDPNDPSPILPIKILAKTEREAKKIYALCTSEQFKFLHTKQINNSTIVQWRAETPLIDVLFYWLGMAICTPFLGVYWLYWASKLVGKGIVKRYKIIGH